MIGVCGWLNRSSFFARFSPMAHFFIPGNSIVRQWPGDIKRPTKFIVMYSFWVNHSWINSTFCSIFSFCFPDQNKSLFIFMNPKKLKLMSRFHFGKGMSLYRTLFGATVGLWLVGRSISDYFRSATKPNLLYFNLFLLIPNQKIWRLCK